MLVLTRKTSQQIVINDDIVITIVKIDGSKVRIGIQAPDDVSIQRAELLQPTFVEVDCADLVPAAC